MSDRLLRVMGLAAAVFAVASVVYFGVAMGFDPSAGAELVQRLATVEASDAVFVRWGAVTDMLGYYLLPVVVIVAVRKRIVWPNPTVRDVVTVAGVMYGTIGAIGAAALASAAPALIESGSTDAQLVLETLGRVVQGLWQWLEALPFIVWAGGVALALRPVRPVYSAVFGVMSLGGVLVWIGAIFELLPVLIAGLGLWLIPFPVVIGAVAWWAPREATS